MTSDGVAGGRDRRHRRGEGAAAAVGHVVVAEGSGIGDHRLHLRIGNAELLRRHQRQRGARTAHVDRADGQRHGTVGADVEVGAGLAAEVEPETTGHATPLVLAEWRLHVRMLLRRFQRGPDADRAIHRTVRRFGAFPGSVPDAEFNRVHADLLRQLIDDAFHREGGHRCRRRAIGRCLGPIDQHLIADRFDVLKVVAGKRGHGAELGPHAAVRGRRNSLAWP